MVLNIQKAGKEEKQQIMETLQQETVHTFRQNVSAACGFRADAFCEIMDAV